MDARQANVLLTRAGLVDGRHSSAERAEVWADVLADLPFEEGDRALREFHRTSSGWVTPADLIRLAKVLRDRDRDERRRAEALEHRPEEPPPPLTLDDKARLNEVYRAERIRSRAARGIRTPLPAADLMFPEAAGHVPPPAVSSAYDFHDAESRR